MSPRITKTDSTATSEWQANMAQDNARINTQQPIQPIIALEDVIRKNIRKNLDLKYRLANPTAGDRVSDVGTQLVSGMKTLGGSFVGDAIKGISPKAAEKVSQVTGGFITPTSNEDYITGRLGTPLDKVDMTAQGVSSALLAELGGKVMDYAGNKIAKELSTIEFLPKPKPTAHYRNIGGKNGYMDVVNRGEVAPPLVSKPGEKIFLRDPNGKVQLRQKQFNRAYYAHKGDFSPSLRYSGPYAVEADIPMVGPWGGNWGNAPDPDIMGFMNVPVNNQNVRLLKQYRFPGTEKVILQKELSKTPKQT